MSEDVPVEELQVGDIVVVVGYAFRILELYPTFTNALGWSQRHFVGEAVGTKPGGGYNRGTYSAGNLGGVAYRLKRAD